MLTFPSPVMPRLVSVAPSPAPETPEPAESPFRDAPTPPPGSIPPKARDRLGLDDDNTGGFAPYSDDPERGPEEPSASQLLQQQRQLMDGAPLPLSCPRLR
jgi:hypothetical protein